MTHVESKEQKDIKTLEFEAGDIVKGINPFYKQYGRDMQVVGRDSKGFLLLQYIDGSNQEEIRLLPGSLELIERRANRYACGGYISDATTWAGNINYEFMTTTANSITEDKLKAAEQSVNRFNNIIKENKMATEKLTIEVDVKQLGLIGKTKKEKTPKIVCKIDGELMEFKNEEALKAFMWTSRCNEVIRYDLTGKVSVPFELTTTEVK